ncbi:MAG TPA: thioesterase [Campylobacterales bacterium]|nr:thioesterase [Campylobacterales bacterium]
MELKTHLEINPRLTGKVVELKEGYAKVKLETSEVMRADAQGLVHGGFAFGAADYAAMAAVNDPNVVLAKSESKFLAPVRVGEHVVFEGNIIESNGAKHMVEVVGMIREKKVFVGTFYTVVLEQHVLEV